MAKENFTLAILEISTTQHLSERKSCHSYRDSYISKKMGNIHNVKSYLHSVKPFTKSAAAQGWARAGNNRPGVSYPLRFDVSSHGHSWLHHDLSRCLTPIWCIVQLLWLCKNKDDRPGKRWGKALWLRVAGEGGGCRQCSMGILHYTLWMYECMYVKWVVLLMLFFVNVVSLLCGGTM